MCGIAGSIGDILPNDDQVKFCKDTLQHRGPNASGHRTEQFSGFQSLLIHTRLSIIDLEDRSNQPYTFDHLVLSYNGEIYNYREVQKELESKGYSFQTGSDTEVLIKAWHCWQEKCLDKLEGMWAFALLDKQQQKLILCRDRFGEKPLYYYRHNGTFYFASEPKAIETLVGGSCDINLDKIRTYLVNGFRSLHKENSTFFNGMREFPKGCYAELASGDEPKAIPYWKLTQCSSDISLSDAVEKTRELLERSVQLRLRSDVPLAFCLSGGIDSTSLACIAAKRFNANIDTFSVIDSDPRYNEVENIDIVANSIGCRSHKIYTGYDGFIDRMRTLVSGHDAPVPTISYYVHSFLSEQISKNGFKVAISGTAADEIFTGYYDHYSFWLASQAGAPDIDEKLAVWKQGYGRHVNNPELKDPMAFAVDPNKRNHIYQNRSLFNGFMVEEVTQEFREEKFTQDLLRNRMINELFHEVVPVILKADDNNSMQWSVENRSPFLDRDLVEFLYSVPNEHLIQGGLQKWLLRAAVKDILPDPVRLNSEKKGFNAAIDSMLDRNDPKIRQVLLDDSPIFDIVKKDALEEFLNNDLTDNSFSKFMFYFVSAKLFLETRSTK